MTRGNQTEFATIPEATRRSGLGSRWQWYGRRPAEGKDARGSGSHPTAPDTLALPAIRRAMPSESEGESPLAPRCYRCLRYEPLPMCPEWPPGMLARREGFEPPTLRFEVSRKAEK